MPSLVAVREAMKSLRVGAYVGRCVLCGRQVLATDRYLRVRGAVFHERCAAYRRRRLVRASPGDLRGAQTAGSGRRARASREAG
jgi:hypothetical protein